ncbi:hypothetical protein FDN75_04575 [Campylobacter jejuni]|nr:hypothetical protein [Campylobacter jejuni]EAL3346065.1 hypothetical protein [Campylobacter jejuni]
MQTKYFKFLAYFSFIISLIYGFYHIIKAFDFVKEAYIYTGIFALIFLNLSLLFSLLKFKKTRNYPKILGIFAAFVGGKIKCRKRKIKCRIFATNYLSFNLKLKL